MLQEASASVQLIGSGSRSICSCFAFFFPLPSVEFAPSHIAQLVAMQLNVQSQVLAEYSTRRLQMRDEYLVQIRGYLKLHPYSREEDDPRLARYFLPWALQRDDPAVLLEEAEDWLREEGILFSAESTNALPLNV